MSIDLDQLLERAASGPVPSLDTDLVLMRGRRRRRVRRAGVVGAVVALVGVVVVAADLVRPVTLPLVGTVGDEPSLRGDSVVVETVQGSAAASLSVLPHRVPAGEVPATVVVNDGVLPVWATPQCALDQWVDGGWVDLGRHEFSPPVEIAAGRPGPWASCVDDMALDAGRYRVRWQLTGGGARLDRPRMALTGEFEVVDAPAHEVAADLPDTARPATDTERPTDELAEVMNLQPQETVFTMPTARGSNRVYVVAREGEWPMMAATSCDVLSSAELPTGWSGECLERTYEGRRLSGRYPHGTTSTPSAGCRRLPPDELRVTGSPVGVPLQPAIRQGLRDGYRLAGPVMAVLSPDRHFETPWTAVAARVATADGDPVGVAVWLSPDDVATWIPDQGTVDLEGFRRDPGAHLAHTYVTSANELAERTSVYPAARTSASAVPRAERCGEATGP